MQRRLVWQSVTPAFPHGEGGSRVPRKRETDEGLATPYSGADDIYPLSRLRRQLPQSGSQGEKRIATSAAGLLAMTYDIRWLSE